ncbi:unnamed protein product [Mytilus edulis]|uniref:TTF-type domain-containing protein n=1 Tax=Mytilus edulis TaxID=6550 RepID=A0A8S3VHZ4_MYTED|nr:unnamed protein product [Mytilus edulis]
MKITFSPKVKSVEALKLRERQRSKLCIDQVSTSRSSVRGSLTRVTDISTFINDFTTSNLSDLSITPADCKTTCSKSSIKKITTEDCSKNGYREGTSTSYASFGASYPQKKTQTNCYSRFKTEPIANSTMIDILDNTVVACSLSCKPNEFAPSVQSTMLHEWLPCASSTVMKKRREQFEESTCYSFTDVETWSINEVKKPVYFMTTTSDVTNMKRNPRATHVTFCQLLQPLLSVEMSLALMESLLKQSDPTNSDPYYFSGKSLNDSDRTQLLFDIKMSSSTIVFPATDVRRYSSKWEEKFPWLRYSIQKDAAFCINCLAFCNYKDGDVFTDKGFNDWENATGSKRGVLLSHNE